MIEVFTFVQEEYLVPKPKIIKRKLGQYFTNRTNGSGGHEHKAFF